MRYVPQDEVTDKQFEEKELTDVKMRNNRENGDTSLTFSNLISVSDLKQLYLAEVGQEDKTLRLMYGGREMKD